MGRRGVKPKDHRTVEQRAAQRAVERMKKPPAKDRMPPQVSKLAHLGDRKRGKEPCQRLRGLPIIDEVVTCIKRGWPDIEVARFIHQEGHLEQVSLDNLRREVRRYRTRVLRPMDVAQDHLSEGAMQAVREVSRGIDELGTIERNILKQQALIDRTMAAIGAMCSEAEQRAAQPRGDEAASEAAPQQAAGRPRVDVPPKLREAEGLSDEDVRAYLMASNFAFKQLEKHFDTIGKNLLRSAQIKNLLGLTEMSNPMVREEAERAGDEETIVAYSRRRFVGRADARKVLEDPESRNRITSLFQRAINDGLLHRDLEAGTRGPDTIEAHAEPVEGPVEAPSEGPPEDDPAPKVA